MPIRINLLAEAQAAEEMRRKDPVKRSIWIAGFVVFLVLLVSVTLQLKIMQARSEVASVQTSWKTIEKPFQEVNDQRNRKNEFEKKLSALDQFTTNRTLWANALDALQHTPVPDVQLVRLRTEQVFEVAVRTNSATKQPLMAEKTIVTLEGRDSASKGEGVPNFKQSISTNAYFQQHLQKTNKVQLTSLSAPQGEAGRFFRAFGMQMFFDQKERYLHE
jgi:hypothetical protein